MYIFYGLATALHNWHFGRLPRQIKHFAGQLFFVISILMGSNERL